MLFSLELLPTMDRCFTDDINNAKKFKNSTCCCITIGKINVGKLIVGVKGAVFE